MLIRNATVLVFSISRFSRVYALRKSEQTAPTLSCTARVVAAVIIIIVAVAVTLASPPPSSPTSLLPVLFVLIIKT
ncbi:hypothetical protein AWZ03_008961 [Drosophila navojoa]|uniref:Uncharacterized protein n=1 Tax=Drosophila navojoa TaxID=7232 RepID=A0A484B9D2_DRONA|nr:hypothetical protein AWZ03_008961 [Drosophila navojoa]